MLGDPSRAMCGAKHRWMPKLVEERLGHGHFGEDLIQDRGSCSVVGDCSLCHLQPMEGELGLYLGQLNAGWRSEQRVLVIDREGALVQELGSAARETRGPHALLAFSEWQGAAFARQWPLSPCKQDPES